MPCFLSPTAGYILNVGHGAAPGPIDKAGRELLRALSTRVLEIAALPCQAEKRSLWYCHSKLEPVRPLLLVFPEDSWEEILPADRLTLADPFWRQWEWYLRHLIYRHESIPDDSVIEPDLWVPTVLGGTGWGMAARYQSSGMPKGSYVWYAPIEEERDLDRLARPTVSYDAAATRAQMDALGEVLGDLMPIRRACPLFHANIIGEATWLRGLQQVLVDMYDRPAWLHRLMGLISESLVQRVEHLEREGVLTLNNRGHYNDSGGVGWSDELPSDTFDGDHVRLQDLWGFGVAQEMDGVGPAQHEEFVLQYQLPLLERCGLNAYGCCEPYTTKFDMLRKVPRLRRVSVSPWCDREVAAARLRDECIFSWKPNPAMLVGRFSSDAIRADIERTLDIAHGCVLEIVLKDTFTLEHEPQRIEAWAQTARAAIDARCGG